VRGKMEWMYRGYNGLPYNNFDAQPLHAPAVYPGPGGTAVPSLDYEWMRIGLDDLAYLNTLQRALEDSRGDLGKIPAVAAAEAFLHELEGMIEDDMNKYRDPDSRDSHQWPVARYDELREEIIDLILGFQVLPGEH